MIFLEIKAAKEACLQGVLIKREDNTELPKDLPKEIKVISTFADLCESSSKRKNEDSEAVEVCD